MKNIVFILAGLFLASALQAQARFLGTVKIEFERTVYEKQLFKELMPDFFERMKDRLPEKTLTYSDFTGDTARSLYAPGRALTPDPRSGYMGVADKNTVYTDFRKGTSIAQKVVFEETFLVTDSLPKIQWKLTPDTRTIAGYECHKAVGLLHDSITVFAFYTDEILVSGGPESFHGLPGMILGAGVPRLHTTWFATKVESTGVDVSKAVPATRGKKTDQKSMMETIKKSVKNWGAQGRFLLMSFAL